MGGKGMSLNLTLVCMGEGENHSPVLGFLGVVREFPPFICMGGGGIRLLFWAFSGLIQRVFPLFPIHLHGCLRSPIYPLLTTLLLHLVVVYRRRTPAHNNITHAGDLSLQV